MKIHSSNPLWINMLDAQELGIGEGDKVRVTSPWGEVEIKAKPTWGIMRGVLASGGGFGHIRGLEDHETQLHRERWWNTGVQVY